MPGFSYKSTAVGMVGEAAVDAALRDLGGGGAAQQQDEGGDQQQQHLSSLCSTRAICCPAAYQLCVQCGGVTVQYS